MSVQTDHVDLALNLAVLVERMNERYDKGWALLREDLAKQNTEMARRDAANTRWLFGVIVAATAIIIAVVLSNT
ncbi:MAG: hypothetical protein OXD45_07880 [Rhodobacteraceae bacterium]|nr:hypothetical protein [Paracoccaceae bacterium]